MVNMAEFDYDMIEQYLSGTLQGQALTEFEAKVKNNADLAAEVNLYRRIQFEMTQQSLNQKEEATLKATLHSVGKNYFDKAQTPVVPIFERKWLVASMAAAVAVLVFMLWPSTGQNITDEELFASFSTKSIDPLSFDTRGKEDSVLILAGRKFNSKDYAAALQLFNSVAQGSDNAQIQLAKGICLMQTAQYNQAKLIFEQIEKGSSVFVSKAVWYKALIALQQKDRATCKKLLQQISADADDYKDAQELLKLLEQ